MKNFFEGIKTMDELKKLYKKLVKENHPDLGGDEQTMKDINNAYEKAVEWIKKHGEAAEAKKAANEVPAEFMAAVNAIISIPELVVELVGRWIWVTGNTYNAKEQLKAAGYKFASKKRAWYWHSEEDSSAGSHMSLAQIKAKYGCETLTQTDEKKIAIEG